MLTALRIKNLALVEDLTLELQSGYNVITGETGAGKSILIGALSLVLGERADRTLIRDGCDLCLVEAVFDISKLKPSLEVFLADNGVESCEEGQLVLKRSFTATGANRQFINGSPTTLNVLAELGLRLVDIHGPHDHQSLLHSARQLAILDAFGKLDSLREDFSGMVRQRVGFQAEKAALIVDEKTYLRQLDLLRFQVQEITDAHLLPDEDLKLEQDYRRASNSARLLQLYQSVIELLSENESSLLNQASLIGRTLQDLQRLDPSTAALVDLHNQAVSLFRDLQNELSHYGERLEVDPARLQSLEDRSNLLHSLKRKYGASLAEVQAFGEQARRSLESLERRDVELVRINKELENLGLQLITTGLKLAAKRRQLLPQLGRAVSQQLADLGFKQCRFEIEQKTLSEAQAKQQLDALAAHGLDSIEFQFAPNPGEAIRPLRAIASSGELARVMLALKTVLAAEDQIPVLVFDEVDANVGGETARTVGEKMRQLAKKRQVLGITHLPQVAAPASAHFLASKQVKAGRTISKITLLEPSERVSELARMLGGQTEAALRHAEALLK